MPLQRLKFNSGLLLALIFIVLVVLHFPLLKLPYFWDEAGYYVPAARDLLLTGSLIPHTTPSNAHPPLVMAYLALWWKIAGYAPLVTRTAMLLAAAFALLGIFRLAQRIANAEVATASVLCTALYPPFFTQSSLGHVDLAAAGLTFWAWRAYIEDRKVAMAVWFSLAALAKETAILVPLALLAWELTQVLLGRKKQSEPSPNTASGMAFLFVLIPLGLWYAYHYLHTGFIFGNAEFFRYNVKATMHPLRIFLALLMRLWQCFGYMNLYVLTVAGLLAMWRPALHDGDQEQPRIAWSIQLSFLAVLVIYVLAMAVIGGAVLARYMLPVVPLVIMVFVSTLWRRVQLWRWIVTIVVLGFVVSLFVNPPYSFAFEDNLAYRDYIQLHQNAEHFLEARYPMGRVLTAWPATDEITRPATGYITRPMRIVRIEDFRVEELMAAADLHSAFDTALVFSTKYEPPYSFLRNWKAWDEIKIRYFDYHHDVPPILAAQILGGDIVYSEYRNGQWIAVIEMHQVLDAKMNASRASGDRSASSKPARRAALAANVEHPAPPA